MQTSSPTIFRHRHNRDDTWDSICTKCYLTVETALLEEDLAGAERSHDCAELLATKYRVETWEVSIVLTEEK